MTNINENELVGQYNEHEEEEEPRRLPVIPLGEAETEETMHGLVGYTRQVNFGDRDNNCWAKMELPFPIQPGWEMDQVAVQAVAYFNTVVSVVSEQLGLPVMVTDSGVVREAIHRHFPDAEEVGDGAPRRQPQRRQTQQRRQPARQQQQNSAPRRSYPHPSELDKPDHIEIEDWEDLCNNSGDWYDNRSDKAQGIGHPQQPDFRHKTDGTALWLQPYNPAQGGGNRARRYQR